MMVEGGTVHNGISIGFIYDRSYLTDPTTAHRLEWYMSSKIPLPWKKREYYLSHDVYLEGWATLYGLWAWPLPSFRRGWPRFWCHVGVWVK